MSQQTTNSERRQVACPVVIRQKDSQLQFLAVRIPNAGTRIINCDIGPEEPAKDAASRELTRQTGIQALPAIRDLGTSNGIARDERWHFFLMKTAALPDQFEYRNDDDQPLSFFWQSFDTFFGDDWHPDFIRAIRHVQKKLESMTDEQRAAFFSNDDAGIADTIRQLLAERGAEKSICPSEVARHLAGTNEKEWRKLMKPIRSEAVRMALASEVDITRKGKVANPNDFKGIYRIRLPKS